MIVFPRRRSAKSTPTQTQTSPKKASLLLGFRSSSKSISESEEEKKGDSDETEPVSTTSPKLSMAQVAMASASVNLADAGSRNIRPSAPVDLDISVFSCDSDEGALLGETRKESMHDLLDLGNANHNAGSEEQEADQACLLFEDEDDDQSPGNVGVAAALRPQVLRSSSPQGFGYNRHDELDLVSLHRPPSEIDVDFDAVPPSPMRDPSVAFCHSGGAPLLPQDPFLGFPSEVEVDFTAELGLRTKLCDAERLVKVILGTHTDKVKRFSTLEQGSILQAIRTFAVMKQELIELRQKIEQKDGDPPAILTNLTSPATTHNTNSFSSPTSDLPTSPDSPSQDDSYHQQRHALRTTRNALVMAAKKCQSLEEQLKQANQTIDRLQPEQDPIPSVEALEERLKSLEADNRVLRSAGTKDEASKTPEELEEILAKLHNVPAVSVSHDERQKIRKYVLEMLESTKTASHQLILEQSQQRELDTRRQLQSALERIESLEAQLRQTQNNDIPNPLDETYRQLQVKDERIAQLEASQARLQSLVQLAVSRSQPLQERNHSDRFRKLDAEYQSLAESVHVLESQTITL